jgi:hypothetical protein
MEQIFKCECCNYNAKTKGNLEKHYKTITHLKKTSIVPVDMNDYNKLQALTNQLQLKYDTLRESHKNKEEKIRYLRKKIDTLETNMEMKLKDHNKRINIRGFVKKNNTKPITLKRYKKIQADLKDMTIRFRNQEKYTTKQINIIWKLKNELRERT